MACARHPAPGAAAGRDPLVRRLTPAPPVFVRETAVPGAFSFEKRREGRPFPERKCPTRRRFPNESAD
ncbi:conserved hypothetical protein [Micrococcus luteus]|nr:conserved hypothetical protein [Micrococcus sp. 116]VXB60537.1 conserved hypothetical protein [Micrococcus luteus]